MSSGAVLYEADDDSNSAFTDTSLISRAYLFPQFSI